MPDDPAIVPAQGLDPEERARLARKGRLLYGKLCGEGGKGTCAIGFSQHQIGQGRPQVAHDLLAFLESRLRALREQDPDGMLPTTEHLARQIRAHLADAVNRGHPGD
jgi:hypothetical protein